METVKREKNISKNIPNNNIDDKNIKIQLNATKRLLKEIEYYQKEICENEKILKEMKIDEKDKYDIKKREEILEESFSVRNETIKKFKIYKENLESLSVKLESENIDNTLLPEINKLLQNSEYII
jgi:GTPase involved in cell partitioning and DNA repair